MAESKRGRATAREASQLAEVDKYVEEAEVDKSKAEKVCKLFSINWMHRLARLLCVFVAHESIQLGAFTLLVMTCESSLEVKTCACVFTAERARSFSGKA
eukprot:1376159-Amorphochlora_amoeboformis.AAC.1